MKLDLHVHTTASDGSVKPARVARMAAAAGIGVLAVADHDTIGGIAEASAEAPPSLRVVPAIEISCAVGELNIHLLGYFVDPAHPGLVAHSRRVIELREARMRTMIELLAGMGIPVEYDAVRLEAGAEAVLGRPHLARTLVATGAVPTVGRAFELYLADRAPAWVPVEAVDLEEAAAIVHAAGGIAVWAHPSADALDARIDAFREQGLDGVECIRARATPMEVERGLAATRARSLIPTGGSDWHGTWHGRLGDFTVGAEQIPEFVELLEARIPPV
ncbi:MAG TPA: PHP domain-containing protein [Longimicrobiales bacterium]|nr:PHP domain-containing protein [Longimicrobiales bacterium]